MSSLTMLTRVLMVGMFVALVLQFNAIPGL